MIIRILFTTILILSPISNAFAGKGYDKLVKDFFPKGTMSNSTSAAIVKEQSAGHYLGGSAVIKAPAEPPLQLFQARAPSCKLGGLPCAAQVNLMGGALSMVSGDDLVRYLKSLPQTAQTYGAMMAIKSLCPQCQDLLEWLDAKADALNKLSMDKCQMVQNLIDPMFPKENAKKEALRQSNLVLNQDKPDMAQIQSGKDESVANNKQLESQLGENYNLVWKALEKKVTSDGDGLELKQLLMSISGTIIGTTENEQFSVRHLKSLINKDLIREFIGFDGVSKNKIKLYKCDEHEKCLKPMPNDEGIPENAFIFKRIKEILEGIVEKVRIDKGPWTQEEELLIGLSSTPLLPKIEYDLSVSGGADITSSQMLFVEGLCFDVVTGYLQELLSTVQEAVGELSHSQISDREKFKAFDDEARETMRTLMNMRMEARSKYDLIQKEKMRIIQQKEIRKKMIEYNLEKITK